MWAGESVQVSLSRDTPTLSGERVGPDDPRVRLIGGRYNVGTGYPGSLVRYPASTTYNADPSWHTSFASGFEFQLTGNSFEWFTVGSGVREPTTVEVDGVATNVAGYPSTAANDGGLYYQRVDLPPSASPRRVRVLTPGRTYGGLVLPPTATIAAAPPLYPANVVFIGDSITEGAVASAPWLIWASQASYRLGFDNPIISGVGASGYLAALQDRSPVSPDYTFRQRLGDVTQAVDGLPPDMVVIAGGINDLRFTPEQIGAEALLYFRAIRQSAPNTVIVVFAPWSAYDLYTDDEYKARDAIFAAAAKVPGTYTVDVSNWVTLSNRDYIFAGRTNGPHPIDAGHEYYGILAAQAIAKIIQSLP